MRERARLKSKSWKISLLYFALQRSENHGEGTTWIIINCNVQVSILMTCVMNNSVRIPFRSYFELGATQELFSETVNITHTTLKKHKDSSWNVLWHHYGKWLSISLQRTICSKCTIFFWGIFHLTKLHFWTHRHIFFHLLAYLLSLLGSRYWRTWTNIASLVFYVNVLCLWVMWGN